MTDEEMIAEARRWLAALNRPSVLMEQWCHALLRALDAAEARAAELERELAAVHENKRCDIDELDVRVERGALRARLTLAERVVEAARREVAGPHDVSGWNLRRELENAIAALDAHAEER